MQNPQIYVSAKSTHDLELDFGYIILHATTGHHTKNCTKLLQKSFYKNHFVKLTNLPR
jgi:hypothetical protein